MNTNSTPTTTDSSEQGEHVESLLDLGFALSLIENDLASDDPVRVEEAVKKGLSAIKQAIGGFRLKLEAA
jgi:hypothetical protein